LAQALSVEAAEPYSPPDATDASPPETTGIPNKPPQTSKPRHKRESMSGAVPDSAAALAEHLRAKSASFDFEALLSARSSYEAPPVSMSAAERAVERVPAAAVVNLSHHSIPLQETVLPTTKAPARKASRSQVRQPGRQLALTGIAFLFGILLTLFI